MIILLFVHLAESLGMFICWFCSCLEMFSIIPHFMKHMPHLFIVFITHLQYFWSFFCGMFFPFGFYVLDNNFCLSFLVLWLWLSFPFWFLDLSCRWSWLSIFWHSWHGWLTFFCLFSWYRAGHSLLSLSFWFMWTHHLFYPQWSHYHLFSPLLSALTRHQLFSFQLTILYQCALFWIIFLAAIFDLAHGFSISTVLITPVFVFLLMSWKIHVIFLVSWRLFLYLLMSFFACHDTLFWLCSLFCPTVLLVLFLFYGFSLPLIRSRWFLVDFHASFLLVKSIQSSLSLFVLVICLWLCFWNSISFGINILDNFSLHSTVSSYNLDLSFVCQHFSMPLHVPQSLLCVGYCDCWFYSKIFMIPSVISIGLCWCLPHAYKLHFDDYFIVDFELSPDQAFSLDSMNVCYHLYWLSDGCVVLILISISFWICGFVFSDFCSSPFLIVNLWLWICLTGFILMLDDFSFCFVSSKLDWIFPSVLMMFLKNSWYLQSNSGLNCTSWIWMYSVVNLFGFFTLLSQIPCL